MSSGIIAKKVQKKSREFDSRARRYVFFPLHGVDFFGSQPTSPVWQPKMPMGRLVLLEELSYWTNADNELSEDPLFAEGAGLVEKSMGTDAQVSYVLSQFGARGMIEVKSITDLDPVSASEIDELLFGTPYEDLYDLKVRLEKFKSKDLPISELANAVAKEALASVMTSIAWAETYCNELDREIQEGRAGRRGRTQVNTYDKFMFKMIRRALPVGHDAPPKPSSDSSDLAKVLKELVAGNAPTVDVQEFEALKAQNKELEKSYKQAVKTIADQQKVIEGGKND